MRPGAGLGLATQKTVKAMSSTKIKDGASLRKRRILDLLAYIGSAGSEGVTVGDIQSYLLINFGLKNETSSKMLGELHKTGFLRCNESGRWFQTKKCADFSGWMYKDE